MASGPGDVHITVPRAGRYTFNLWMREDGVKVDKIILNRSGSRPDGNGAAESDQAAAAADEIQTSAGQYLESPVAGRAGFGDGGTSVELNGSNQFIEAPHVSAYLLNEATVAFWFYANDLTGGQGLVTKDSAGHDDGGHLQVRLDNGMLKFRVSSNTTNHNIGATGVSANRWHHVVAGFGGDGMRLYLDGNLVASNTTAVGMGTQSGGSGNAEPWTFGVDQEFSGELTSQGWNKPFHGRLDDIRLYNQNFDATQAAQLFAGLDPGPAVPDRVLDSAGVGDPLDLRIADPANITWVASGLSVDAPTTIASPAAATRLHTSLSGGQVLTLEADFTPANITQTGPARIVSYSDGTSQRNLQLGQSETDYNVRLRTQYNSSGTPEAASEDVLAAGARQHVVATYDGESLRLYRNGVLETTEPWVGDLSNWNDAYRLLLVNEESGNRAWLGTLHRVAIWDGPVDAIQADNLYRGNTPGLPNGGDNGLTYTRHWLEAP